jgi:hypothetical protein
MAFVLRRSMMCPERSIWGTCRTTSRTCKAEQDFLLQNFDAVGLLILAKSLDTTEKD